MPGEGALAETQVLCSRQTAGAKGIAAHEVDAEQSTLTSQLRASRQRLRGRQLHARTTVEPIAAKRGRALLLLRLAAPAGGCQQSCCQLGREVCQAGGQLQLLLGLLLLVVGLLRQQLLQQGA